LRIIFPEPGKGNYSRNPHNDYWSLNLLSEGERPTVFPVLLSFSPKRSESTGIDAELRVLRRRIWKLCSSPQS